jgi:hypothetical protein
MRKGMQDNGRLNNTIQDKIKTKNSNTQNKKRSIFIK